MRTSGFEQVPILFQVRRITMSHKSRVRRLNAEKLEDRQLMAADIGFDPTDSRLPGDANEDGVFNQDDLVQVFQAGKYSTGGSATWDEGDWNHDRVFDPGDLVAAFRAGGWNPNASSTAPNLTASLVDGVLAIKGSDQADTIVVRQTGNRISIDGLGQGFDADGIRGIVIDAHGGDDDVRLDVDGQVVDKASLIFGGAGNDHIRAGHGHDTVFLGTGGDIAVTHGGHDIVFGGDGSDEIVLGAGDDFALGEAGHDKISGEDGNDQIDTGQGDDEAYGHAGNDTIVGGVGNDGIWSGDGNDQVAAGDGDDRVSAGAGHDTVHGEAGRDQIFGELGRDAITGGDGDDWLYGGDDDDQILGDESNDYIEGNSGNDIMLGEAGEDTLYGGQGNDELRGGTGHDALFGQEGRDAFRDNYFTTQEDWNVWRETWNGISMEVLVGVILPITIVQQISNNVTAFTLPDFINVDNTYVLEMVNSGLHGSITPGDYCLFCFPQVQSGG
jgi:Ca2+-binding RTX toxin-like protein